MAITSEYYYNNYTEFEVTSDNSFTTVGTVADDGSQRWETDFKFSGFELGEIYRLDLDYVKTNDAPIGFSLVETSEGEHAFVVGDTLTENEGHVVLTFKAEEENMNTSNSLVFCVTGSLSNTVTVSNVTFTERWFDYELDYTTDATVTQFSPHEIMINYKDDISWEVCYKIPNLAVGTTYYLTYDYETTGFTEFYNDISDHDSKYLFKPKGKALYEFTATLETSYLSIGGKGLLGAGSTLIRNFKISTEPPIYDKTNDIVMSVSGNKVYLNENYEHHLGGLGIKKVEIDRNGSEDAYLDNDGTLHCVYITNDLEELLQLSNVNGTSGLTDHWHYEGGSTFEFVDEHSIDYTILRSNWDNEFWLPVKAGKKYRFEYDLYNGTDKTELTSTIRINETTITSERWTIGYLAPCHIRHEFLATGEECWLLHDWTGDDVVLDAPQQVKVRNLKLIELADDYQLGILNHYWQGGTDEHADWYFSDDNGSSVLVLGQRGKDFVVGIDFYLGSTQLEVGGSYMFSCDYELSDAFLHQQEAWAGCHFSFWTTESMDLSGWIQLTDGNGKLKGHIESPNFTIPSANGNLYINIEGVGTRYYNSWIKLSNVKVFTKLYNNRSMEVWWVSDGMDVDLTEPDTYILTRNPEVLTTNHGEIAHQLYGFEEGVSYVFKADVEYTVSVEPVQYMSNWFRITDGHDGSTTLSEEQFIIINGEPLTQTKHVEYTFTGSSDAIGIYCSSWVENDDIDKGFTLKMTNIKITKK